MPCVPASARSQACRTTCANSFGSVATDPVTISVQSAAATLWAQADQDVTKDAPFYPITQPLQPLYHASYVHNAIYVPALQAFDPTNVWLSSPGS